MRSVFAEHPFPLGKMIISIYSHHIELQCQKQAKTPSEHNILNLPHVTFLEWTHICFINGKSTRSRTGLVVHLTAPTIHAGWSGNITLEMTNCGPLDLVLHAADAVAQLTVAKITQPPTLDVKLYESATHGQTSVYGAEPDTFSS